MGILKVRDFVEIQIQVLFGKSDSSLYFQFVVFLELFESGIFRMDFVISYSKYIEFFGHQDYQFLIADEKEKEES